MPALPAAAVEAAWAAANEIPSHSPKSDHPKRVPFMRTIPSHSRIRLVPVHPDLLTKRYTVRTGHDKTRKHLVRQGIKKLPGWR